MGQQSEWEQCLTKELKSSHLPHFELDIEGLSWHFQDNNASHKTQIKWESNHKPWELACFHRCLNEKITNQAILNDLNQGAEILCIELESALVNLDVLFAGIHFEFIKTYVHVADDSTFYHLENWCSIVKPKKFKITYFSHQPEFEKKSNFGLSIISGFEWFAMGANAQSELNYSIFELNKQLCLYNNQPILIEMGIGENTIVEIAKFRALNLLITALVNKLDVPNLEITVRAKTGWRNKSSHDLPMNQLRQTNEAMIAILGGVQELCITPSELHSQNEGSQLSRRMSMNISNLLKNESHLDLYHDLTKGSHMVDFFTEHLCDETWRFLSSEDQLTQLQNQLDHTLQKRINSFKNNESALIGMNCFVVNEDKARSIPHKISSFGRSYFYFESL